MNHDSIKAYEGRYCPEQHPMSYSIEQEMADALFRNHFEDTSWRNDICASFSLHEKTQVLRIWIEAMEMIDRETENERRYVVTRYTPDYEFIEDIMDTDSLTEALGCCMVHATFERGGA